MPREKNVLTSHKALQREKKFTLIFHLQAPAITFAWHV